MLSFLLYWLIHQYVLYTLHQPFLPAQTNPVPVPVSETIIGYYRCPNDYQIFPDEEALLIHWQIDHPFQYGDKLSEISFQQDWLETLKIQR